MAMNPINLYAGYFPNAFQKSRQPKVNPQNQVANYYAGLEAQARAENLAAEKEVRGIRQSQINRYGKDSAFYQAGLADIENQASELVGAETQNLVSSGLYGTTTAASVPTRIANTFTRPARLKLESLLEEKRSAAELGLADFIERIERPYPDYNALFQASQAAGTK